MSPSLHRYAALGLVLSACLVTSLPAAATESASQPGALPAPKAKPATNLRSVHLQVREKCEAQANEQSLEGEARKVYVGRCLQGK